MPSTVHATTCPLDCPDSCALQVTIDGESIVSIAGGRDHPDTAGFICSKVAKFAQRVDHAERVLYPARRVGPKGEGRFERISWEEAIDEIVERLERVRERWGSEAILPFHYGGSNGELSDDFLDALFFERLGASRLAKTICGAPTSAVATEMYGKMPGVAFADYRHGRLIVVWGANPRASHIHLVPYLREAKRRGARLVTIDPRRTFGEAETDLHLPVRPGTDLPLALALIRCLEEAGALDREFLERHADGVEPLLAAARRWPPERAAEVCGVPAGDIERLATLYATLAPAVIRCGWGIERNRNGGRAAAAILALPALAGKFGVRGGGYTMSNSRAHRLAAGELLGIGPSSRRVLNMTRLGELLNGELDPPLRALFVYNANPVATVPDQNRVLAGLAREDLFTVVHEQVMTDTARYADLLLPATTFLEHRDLRVGYGAYVLGGVAPVITPRGEARSNVWLFAALGRAMGFADEAFTWDEETALRRATGVVMRPGGPPDADHLLAGGNSSPDFPGPTPVQFDTVLPPTADGRAHLTPPVLGADPFRYETPDETFPLALISPATSRTISSTLGEYNLPRLELTLHPDDAASRAIGDGDAVRVFNDLGEVHCTARLDPGLRPGTAAMPKGAWRRASANGRTSVALCPDHLGTAGGACFNDARVEVAALSATPAAG